METDRGKTSEKMISNLFTCHFPVKQLIFPAISEFFLNNQIFQSMLDGTSKLHTLTLTFGAAMPRFPFFRLIGITYREGKYYTAREIEVCRSNFVSSNIAFLLGK